MPRGLPVSAQQELIASLCVPYHSAFVARDDSGTTQAIVMCLYTHTFSLIHVSHVQVRNCLVAFVNSHDREPERIKFKLKTLQEVVYENVKSEG